MIKIALDMMGSDYGATKFIGGLKKYMEVDKSTCFVCFGKKDELKELENNPRIEIVDCSEIVPMETDVLHFLRMKNSLKLLSMLERIIHHFIFTVWFQPAEFIHL